MTGPARSVFAEPLAQARANTQHVSYSPRAGAPHTPDCPGCSVAAALDLIEQRATDMETALRGLMALIVIDEDGAAEAIRMEDWGPVWLQALAALSAREEAQIKTIKPVSGAPYPNREEAQ